MFNHYIYDSESYCERCLPKVTGESLKLSLEIAQENEGEQDTPANCSRCGRPLKYSLTTDGVDYVLEKIQDILDEGPSPVEPRLQESPEAGLLQGLPVL